MNVDHFNNLKFLHKWRNLINNVIFYTISYFTLPWCHVIINWKVKNYRNAIQSLKEFCSTKNVYPMSIWQWWWNSGKITFLLVITMPLKMQTWAKNWKCFSFLQGRVKCLFYKHQKVDALWWLNYDESLKNN